MGNKPLNALDCSGINGSFYAIGNSNIYGVAIQDNVPLSSDSYVSNYDGYKRGTIWFNGDTMNVAQIYNTKDEIKGNIKWAISGIGLYPYYNPKSEGFVGAYSDVLRVCNHTAIGFNGNKVYLIVGKNLSLDEFRNKILNSSIAFTGLINLDGGGSTQMKFGSKDIVKSTRVLNHIVKVVK